jgi:hypothetical protein
MVRVQSVVIGQHFCGVARFDVGLVQVVGKFIQVTSAHQVLILLVDVSLGRVHILVEAGTNLSAQVVKLSSAA